MTMLAERPTAAAPPPQRHAPGWRVGLRAVIVRGLRDQRRGALGWGLSLGALGAFMAAVYPSVQKSIEAVSRNYPSGLKEAFGIQAMNTVEGYIHAEMFSLIVPVAIGYFAIRGVARPVVGAEDRGYLDTILALPIARWTLIAGSFVVTALLSMGILLLTGAMTVVAGRLAGTHISLGLIAAGVVGVWPLALLFAGISALASALLHDSRAVTAIAVGTLVGSYAVDLAGRLASALEPIRWVSPFRYYGSPMLDGIDPASFVGLAGAAVLIVVAAAALLPRRDIHH